MTILRMDTIRTCLSLVFFYSLFELSATKHSEGDKGKNINRVIAKRAVDVNNQTNGSYYGDEYHPAKSCQEIFSHLPNLPSGVYWLEFLKVGSNETFQEQHYCENSPPAPKPSGGHVWQASPPLRGAVKEEFEDLTVGQKTMEPSDPEYLNEQQQWPRPIEVPTEEQMRERLMKARDEYLQKLRNKQKTENGSDGQRSIENGWIENSNITGEQGNVYNKSISTGRDNVTLQNEVLTNNTLQTRNVSSPFLESIPAENAAFANRTLPLNETNNAYQPFGNESFGIPFSSASPSSTNQTASIYDQSLDKNQMSQIPNSQTYFLFVNNLDRNVSVKNDSNGIKTLNNSVRMVLLNWKRIASKDQKEDVVKKGFLHKLSLLAQRKTDSEKGSSNKKLEREALFIKPGLNRGVIQSSILKGNGTLAIHDNDGSKRKDKEGTKKTLQILTERRDGVSTRLMLPDSRQIVRIGEELETKGHPIGDPVKKPNPDELHSGLWTSEAERFMKEAWKNFEDHKELAKKLGGMRNMYDRINELNKNRKGVHDPKNAELTKEKLKDFYNSGAGKPYSEDLGVQNQRIPGVFITTNITAEPSGSESERMSEPVVTKLPARPYYKQSNFSLDGSQRYPSMESRTSSNSGSQSQSHSQAYAQAYAGSSSSAQSLGHTKAKTQSQMNMEKTQAQLADLMQKNKARVDADTEHNYLHKIVQRPEKTAVDHQLDKVSDKLKEWHEGRRKQEEQKTVYQNVNENSKADPNKVEAIVNINYKQPPGSRNKGVKIEANIDIDNSDKRPGNGQDSMDDFEYERIDEDNYKYGSWADRTLQQIPNTAQLNSRLNTMPYARYKP